GQGKLWKGVVLSPRTVDAVVALGRLGGLSSPREVIVPSICWPSLGTAVSGAWLLQRLQSAWGLCPAVCCLSLSEGMFTLQLDGCAGCLWLPSFDAVAEWLWRVLGGRRGVLVVCFLPAEPI
ncbi:hypothetical protein Ancab_039403, partial [Ancistrocladus abbreviatus]